MNRSSFAMRATRCTLIGLALSGLAFSQSLPPQPSKRPRPRGVIEIPKMDPTAPSIPTGGGPLAQEQPNPNEKARAKFAALLKKVSDVDQSAGFSGAPSIDPVLAAWEQARECPLRQQISSQCEP